MPKSGLIMPGMGISNNQPVSIADALFTKVQQRVLGLLFANPDRNYYANEIISLVASGSGAVQRELARLESSGLVTAIHIGRQKHYQANANSPVFNELRGLMLKTTGLIDALRTALSPLQEQIQTAFVFGSVAKAKDTATSDIDLMIISDSLAYADIFTTLEETTHLLQRKINPTVYTRKELMKRIDQDNAFIKRVLEQPKLWIAGKESDISAGMRATLILTRDL
ncbi:MAG: nucleotidyltransferase domain-containing protein [Gammaproteobacteria bacterium]|nr:nucleotidyltransferase domain-containing protein [Gammaproteobacteria bacterium]